MSRSGREALTDVREWAKVTPGSPGVVQIASRKSGSGRKALQDVWEWSGVFPGCPG